MKVFRAGAEYLRFLFSIAAGMFLLFFASCSDSDPRITGLVSNVVFEWEDWESLPRVRLSVFAETSMDERSAGEIKAVHNQSGLEWQCKNPRIISAKKNEWAGYTNFVAASGQTIPQGNYTLYYTDMSGEETQSVFSISYPLELVECKAGDFGNLGLEKEENIALYDADGLLLYYGERKDTWSSNSDIKKEYGVAEKIRVCYRLYSGNAVCMMPEESL